MKDFRLFFEKMKPSAIIPERANSTDAGCDLFSIKKHTIKPGESELIPTGLRCKFNNGYVMMFKDKSGRSVKNKLKVGAGIIDSEYRGELIIHIFNMGTEEVEIKKGEKVCQFLIMPVWCGQPRAIKEISTNTSRGEGGFGSTGV